MRGTVPHITPQEQKLRAAGTLARLSTWPPCPWDVKRDRAFPLAVPLPQALEATAMQRTQDTVEEQQGGTWGLTGAAWAVQKALGHQPVLQ